MLTGGRKSIIVAIVLVALFCATIPAYASVIVNNPFSVGTSQVEPFAMLSNNTTSLSSSQVQVNQYGTSANVSMSGTWKSSSVNSPKTVYGFVSQVLARGSYAYAHIESASVAGSSNLSELTVSFNGSSTDSVKQASLSGGKMVVYNNNVSFDRNMPLNFTVSFSPVSHSSKPIQVEDAFLILNVLTYSGSGASGVFIHEKINIALTMMIFG